MTIRIGNGCGFWGDNLDAPINLAERGRLDYLTLEYLAELTMSILALQKQRKSQAGFATDILDVIGRLAPQWRRQPDLKVITNAGGMNPQACAAETQAILRKENLAHMRIGVVSGDDLLPRLDTLLAIGHPLTNMDSGQPLAVIRERIVSANAYLGAAPIVEALRLGAQIVITGRVADASLTVAPAMHEFGWSWNDWGRLASATVAGHLIECGAQATGGLWCHWNEATDLADVGYPIAEISSDGNFTIGKPDGTGGAVNIETISEQLLYEVGDPKAYLTPDVIADFTSLTLSSCIPNVVSIQKARGSPAPEKLKVSIAYRNGFSASGTLVVGGPNAAQKARRGGEMLLDRLRRAGVMLEHTYVECLGTGDCVPGVIPWTESPEVVLRVAVRDRDRSRVERFTKEFSPLVTSGPPGFTGYTTGRPTVREVFAYWPALIDRTAVIPSVSLLPM
jgi:hypothetical protein